MTHADGNMSKASEWARTSLEAPSNLFLGGWRSAEVKITNGRPWCIVNKTMLKEDEALALARWILDTFGEPKP